MLDKIDKICLRSSVEQENTMVNIEINVYCPKLGEETSYFSPALTRLEQELQAVSVVYIL